ncbi:hypothetical protein RhiirA4_467615 [Rhizophagus irregularis]|uniref:Uncharacterized protein n=1 Tax=Rhizophagus irregularis TaxID=588596 RepID=A0A2I1GW83_9GLOM|nr:hypothetical protein RhiirA4_467615 [Rhizophagus irregularis]
MHVDIVVSTKSKAVKLSGINDAVPEVVMVPANSNYRRKKKWINSWTRHIRKAVDSGVCSTIHVRTKEREIAQKKVLNGYRTCTNRIGIVFSSFGQLRGVNSVGSDADSKNEVSSIINNSSTLVETFENVSDRSDFASSIGYSIITDSEAEDPFDYIASVENMDSII